MVSNQNIKNMEQEMPSKIMGYSDLFTNADSVGNTFAKVNVSVISGDASNGKVYYKDKLITDFLFKRNTLNQLVGKQLKTYLHNDNIYVLDEVLP